jgi:chemotaxis protein CheD
MVTHALGSCIGLTVFDPVRGALGMLHFMPPEASSEEQLWKKPTAMFANTGVPELFRKVLELGANKSNLIVCAAGGSSLMDDKERFQVGKRNRMILRKMSWKNGSIMTAEDTGGKAARTMKIDMTSGQASIMSKGVESILWKA